LLYLAIENPQTNTLEGLTLSYAIKGQEYRRDLLDVPPGVAWDTVWLAEPGDSASACVRQGTNVIWSGQLSSPRTASQVVVRQSLCVKAEDLKPLTLRGLNYYSRHQPWGGLWRNTSEREWEAEFGEMDRLCINSIRTFYLFDADANLHRKDGTFTPELLLRINTFLSVAERHHLKVMLCLIGGSGAPMSDLNFWRRYLRTGVEPFIYDGRILMWDLINEPGGDKGPKATPELTCWIQAMYPELKGLDSNHLATVGLCWQFDQLWSLGVKPDVGQFHEYSGAVGVLKPGAPAQRNVADDLRQIVAQYTGTRPLVIGEFGLYSETGEEHSAEEKAKSLQHQADVYRWVLEAAEATKIAGAYNWTAFQFTPDWMGRKEQTFGVIQPDGSLKPAGEILRDTYSRWRRQSPAPWEPRSAGSRLRSAGIPLPNQAPGHRANGYCADPGQIREFEVVPEFGWQKTTVQQISKGN
jgi:hypothetical protein